MAEPLAEARTTKAAEAPEEEGDEEVDETGVEGKDIELVMTQVRRAERGGGAAGVIGWGPRSVGWHEVRG